MRPVAPRIGAPEIMIAEDQEEYRTLVGAVVKRSLEGTEQICVVTRWTLTDAERAAVLAGEDIYVEILTFGKPLNPLHIQVGAPPA